MRHNSRVAGQTARVRRMSSLEASIPLRDKLFVYGTLRPASRHPMGRVLAHNARPLGRGAIRGRLARFGAYPGVVDDTGGWIEGEVFAVTGGQSVWRVLDNWEGCHDDPAPYERRQIPVWLSTRHGGGWITAWCYMLAAPPGPHEAARQRWLAGGG